jgi:hypothetical protein
LLFFFPCLVLQSLPDQNSDLWLSEWRGFRIILETDSVAIASRVSRPKADVGVGVNLSDITINEQTIMQAFSNLRDKAAQRLLQGSL